MPLEDVGAGLESVDRIRLTWGHDVIESGPGYSADNAACVSPDIHAAGSSSMNFWRTKDKESARRVRERGGRGQLQVHNASTGCARWRITPQESGRSDPN